jgi:hypothetical protein
MEPTSAAAAAPPSQRRRGRKPVAALVLGIAGLATGFTAITLICAVVAITLASLAFQEEAAGGGAPERHGLAVGGMVCGIVALCLWIPVVIAVAITQA